MWDYEVYDYNAIDALVYRLRHRIEADPSNPKYLVTVRGFGYKLRDYGSRRLRNPLSSKVPMKLTMPRACVAGSKSPAINRSRTVSVIFNAVAEGNATHHQFSDRRGLPLDRRLYARAGVEVELDGDAVRVHGRGLRGLQEAERRARLRQLWHDDPPVDRAAGRPDFLLRSLTGDDLLRSRPMARVVEPLRALGARIDGAEGGDARRWPPWRRACTAARTSAGRFGAGQVRAAAGRAGRRRAAAPDRKTASRDHTERMLAAMGIDITSHPGAVTLYPPAHPVFPYPFSLRVPGDPSSAAFWWVAGGDPSRRRDHDHRRLAQPDAHRRAGCAARYGRRITVTDERIEGQEPVGDVTVRSAATAWHEIGGELIPRLIDEIPVLAVAAA